MIKSILIAKTHGVVLYTRVSGNEQAEHGTSLESQQMPAEPKP